MSLPDGWHTETLTCTNAECPSFNVPVPDVPVPDDPVLWGWQGVQCGACQQDIPTA